jgi:hypothetical protein
MEDLKQNTSDAANQVLFANNLTYTLPSSSSIATNRVMKRNYFQNRNYQNDTTMICQYNTGTDFIDPINSTLNLRVKVTPGGNPGDKLAANFGVGSVQNLIKNIRIYHRSGTTYTNTIKQNLFSVKRDRYNKSANWFSSIGSALMGYDEAVIFNRDPDSPDVPVLEKDFQIPLNLLHGFFNPLGEPLMPAVMASGLRVEIDLESARGAFVNATGLNFTTIISYEITDCYFNLMSTSLMDSAVAAVNANAAKNSLEYLYLDLFTSTNSQSANNSAVNIDVNKSVALLNEALTVVQTQAQLNNYTIDQFATAYVPGQWWYQLGSMQFPNVKIDTPLLAYHQALITFDKMKTDDKEADTNFGTFLASDGIYANSFERNSALSLSQVPCNASRSLRFELNYDEAPTVATIVTTYLEYVTSSRSTLLNSRIDI